MEQNAVIIVDTFLFFVPFLIARLRGDLTEGAKLLNNSSCYSTCRVWSHMLINKDSLLGCTHYPMQRWVKTQHLRASEKKKKSHTRFFSYLFFQLVLCPLIKRHVKKMSLCLMLITQCSRDLHSLCMDGGNSSLTDVVFYCINRLLEYNNLIGC